MTQNCNQNQNSNPTPYLLCHVSLLVNRTGTVYHHGLDKGFSPRFCVDSRVWHETPEEGWRTYQPKSCEYNDKDNVNSLNFLTDKKTKQFKVIEICWHFVSLFTKKKWTLLAKGGGRGGRNFSVFQAALISFYLFKFLIWCNSSSFNPYFNLYQKEETLNWIMQIL